MRLKLNGLFLFVLFSVCAHTQAPRVEMQLQWFQQGYYILSPSIGNNKNQIAFIRQLKDTTVGTGSFFHAVKKSFLSTAEPTRFYDPVVSILNANNQLFLIDYGWAPVFSDKDMLLAYAYQKHPLQRMDKLFAATYEGNSIKTFNTQNQTLTEIAIPKSSYFAEPFFTDSMHLLYKTGAVVNGPFGGAVAINEINIATKKSKIIKSPSIRFKQYELMGALYHNKTNLVYGMYSPTETGKEIANQYQHLLMSGTDTLANFGTKRFTNLSNKIAFDKPGNLIYLDDAYYLAEDTSFLVKYNGKTIQEKRPIPFTYTKSWLSPTGQYLLFTTEGLEVFLVNTKDFSATKINMPLKEVRSAVWASDETQIAIVMDDEKLDRTDRLYLFKII